MKVQEVIEKLKTLDAKLEVICYTEDEALQSKGHMFRLLDIESVEVSEGERCRVNEIPTLKFGKGPGSEKLAFINVTGDF
ncbi:MAG TPA: hypothetical protein VFV84_13760 [Burkholderiales bacterium]|nr:hypothetical protein [Burkholderiales bacterium]